MGYFSQKLRNGCPSLFRLSIAAVAGLAVTTNMGLKTSQAEKRSAQEHYTNKNRRTLLKSFVSTFEKGHDYRNWYISDFIIDDDFFQNAWAASNLLFLKNGDVALALTHQKKGKKKYSGAEYQKTGWAQYGRFETIMMSAKGSGVVTGFFTHTGPYFKDPHDEIDIEFLGKNTNEIQFNIYRDGKPMGSEIQKLDYDASNEFHLYAFEWTPTRVTWFIDNEKVFETTDLDFDIPDAPQRLIAQIWTGNIFEWHGKPKFEDGTSAVVRCISYTRLEDTKSEKCSDKPELLTTSSVELASINKKAKRLAKSKR